RRGREGLVARHRTIIHSAWPGRCTPRIAVTSVERAAAAGCHWVNDTAPGLRRIPSGEGFRYLDARGRPVGGTAPLRRLGALVIPPAWRDVWICPSARGHIQAAGRDARGRKVYRYHPRFIAWCAQTKYEHILEFAAALPGIRLGVDAALERPGLERDKVL